MEDNPGFNDAIQTGGPATSRQENNLPVPPARSAMANLYPRSQQPGHQTNPVVNSMDLVQDLPPNHLMLALLSTIFCTCPCGLVSLCYAVRVNSDFERGNTVGAQYNSNQAWKWGMASISVGCLTILVVMVYYLIEVALHVTL